MRRALVAAVALSFGFCLGVGQLAAAQGAGGIGVAVPYTDSDGITRGTVMVKDVADPFTGFATGQDPQAGSRYVDLTVVYEAADDQTFDAQPYYILLRSTDGHLYQPGYVPRPSDAKIPDLQGQTMAPGNRISGAVGYVLPTGATVADVLFQPSGDRSIVLANLVPTPGPAAGTAVPYTSDDGSSATITVKVDDPASDSDPSQPAADGSRYVGLNVAFENTGDAPFSAGPDRILLVDTSGNLYYSTYVPRQQGVKVPVLESQTMASGNRISGFVGYTVPADATIASVQYFPQSDRMITLADLQGGGATPSGSPVPGASAAPVASPAPEVSASPAASAGTAQ